MKKLFVFFFLLSHSLHAAGPPFCFRTAAAAVVSIAQHLPSPSLPVLAMKKGEEALIPLLVRELKAANWQAPILQPNYAQAEGANGLAINVTEELGS